jgi:hypothetical protein
MPLHHWSYGKWLGDRSPDSSEKAEKHLPTATLCSSLRQSPNGNMALGRKKLCVAAQHDLKGAKATFKVTRAREHWQFFG